MTIREAALAQPLSVCGWCRVKPQWISWSPGFSRSFPPEGGTPTDQYQVDRALGSVSYQSNVHWALADNGSGDMIMVIINLETRPFSRQVRPSAALNSPSRSGNGSRPSCRTGRIVAGPVVPSTIPVPSSTASSGSSVPASRDVTSWNAMAPGRRSSIASTAGGPTALGSGLSPRCWANWTTEVRSTTTSGVSMPPSSGPAGRRPARKKTRAVRGGWAGPNRRKCRSSLTMRWGVREAVSARRSIWPATVAASSLASI